MFSVHTGLLCLNHPRLRESYDYWYNNNQGRLISGFLFAQGRITPSIDDMRVTDIRKPGDAREDPNFDENNNPDDRFMDHGNHILLNVPIPQTQSQEDTQRRIKGHDVSNWDQSPSIGLPLPIIRRYCLDQVFTENLDDVRFDNALVALDYLRDLEFTRRNWLRQAARNLSITKSNWESILQDYPSGLLWVEATQAFDYRTAGAYSNLFVELRKWKDFDKAHALAILNTLFPPSPQEIPNEKFDPRIPQYHRAKFYRLLLEVDRNGPQIMLDLVESARAKHGSSSWPYVRKTLVNYLDWAETMVEEAQKIYGIGCFPRVEGYIPSCRSMNTGTGPPMNTCASSEFSTKSLRRSKTQEFGSAEKTLKAISSLGNLRTVFRRKESNPTVVAGVNLEGFRTKKLYSQSMVDVGLSKQPEFSDSTVNVSKKRWDTTPSSTQPRFQSLRPSQEIIHESNQQPDHGLTQEPTQHSTRERALSKPYGFKPPPLEALGLAPLVYAPTVPSLRVARSMDQVRSLSDAEVSLRKDLRVPVSHQYPRKRTESPLSVERSQEIADGLKSVPAVRNRSDKYLVSLLREPGPRRSPSAISPLGGEMSIRERTRTSPLMDSAGPPPNEPLPPPPGYKGKYAALNHWPRSSPESFLAAQPLLYRPETSSSLVTVNEASSVGGNVTVIASSLAKTKRISPSPEEIELLLPLLEQASSNPVHSILVRSSASSDPLLPQQSLRPAQLSARHPPKRLPSDNYGFLKTDPFKSETAPQSQTLKKKSSLSSLLTRRKASATTLNEEFSSHKPFSISSKQRSSSSTLASQDSNKFEASRDSSTSTPRESADSSQRPKPILKKQSSFGSQTTHNPASTIADTKTTKPRKSINFDTTLQFYPPPPDFSDSDSEHPPSLFTNPTTSTTRTASMGSCFSRPSRPSRTAAPYGPFFISSPLPPRDPPPPVTIPFPSFSGEDGRDEAYYSARRRLNEEIVPVDGTEYAASSKNGDTAEEGVSSSSASAPPRPSIAPFAASSGDISTLALDTPPPAASATTSREDLSPAVSAAPSIAASVAAPVASFPEEDLYSASPPRSAAPSIREEEKENEGETVGE
ncbi:hypothetical protein PZA11_007689 [Diplocarpon coronariae]